MKPTEETWSLMVGRVLWGSIHRDAPGYERVREAIRAKRREQA